MQTSITRTCFLYDLDQDIAYSPERQVMTRTRGERHEFVSASAGNTRQTKRRVVRRSRRSTRQQLRDPRTW